MINEYTEMLEKYNNVRQIYEKSLSIYTKSLLMIHNIRRYNAGSRLYYW